MSVWKPSPDQESLFEEVAFYLKPEGKDLHKVSRMSYMWQKHSVKYAMTTAHRSSVFSGAITSCGSGNCFYLGITQDDCARSDG